MDELLNRIQMQPNILRGRPVVRGTRLTVAYVLHLLATSTPDAVLAAHPVLTKEDISACLLFASRFLQNAKFQAPAPVK